MVASRAVDWRKIALVVVPLILGLGFRGGWVAGSGYGAFAHWRDG